VSQVPVGVPLVFVKLEDGLPWFTTFRLYPDGSWGFDFLHHGFDGSSGKLLHRASGRNDLGGASGVARLSSLGFVPLAEAERLGWVPVGWCPPDPATESGPA